MVMQAVQRYSMLSKLNHKGMIRRTHAGEGTGIKFCVDTHVDRPEEEEIACSKILNSGNSGISYATLQLPSTRDT